MKQPQSHLFRRVQMSTPNVLADTLALARASGLVVSLLPAWYDVDTIADLQLLNEDITRLWENGFPTSTRQWLAQINWRELST